MLKLSEATLDWALLHVLNHADTGIFPPSFEFEAIRHDWDALKPRLADVDLDLWVVRVHRRFLAPKGRYAFRVVTQLDPIDLILYAALLYDIGSDIEAARVNRDRGVVYSFRYDPDVDGRLFSPDVGYAGFVESTQAYVGAPATTHVATVDIADFYPRIYHHPLENALAAASGKADHCRCILKLLNGWSDSVSHGLPVGNAPSRLLAELILADVDEALLASGVKFVRFNDDYRIFAGSHTEGYRHIALLANHLYEAHGLTLAPQKTALMPRAVFEERFLREPEDHELDDLKRRFQRKLPLSEEYSKVEFSGENHILGGFDEKVAIYRN